MGDIYAELAILPDELIACSRCSRKEQCHKHSLYAANREVPRQLPDGEDREQVIRDTAMRVEKANIIQGWKERQRRVKRQLRLIV